MKKYLTDIGLRASQNIIVHSSFRSIKATFPGISPEDVVKILKDIITSTGSIVFPAFTYCYKRSGSDYNVFDSQNTPSQVGVLSEFFRNSDSVIRTSSPTHSFSLWGKAADIIDPRNSPSSPLGYGSVLDWLAKLDNSYVLLIGVDFSALTLCHYIEIIAKVPYLNISPWKYLNVMSIGVSGSWEQKLKEIPGCSRSFPLFEEYLLRERFIQKFKRNGLEGYFLPVKPLIHFGLDFLKSFPMGFLCKQGSCRSCDERYEYLSRK